MHVDFNCLFDKVSAFGMVSSGVDTQAQGRTFEVPEKVPFRLTHNIIDGMGVTGVEGEARSTSLV